MRNQHVPLVAHIIYSLGAGGLENGLVNIINRSPPDRYRHLIICLTSANEFAERIVVPDVPIIELHQREGHDLRAYWRLLGILREHRPDIVHSRNLAALDMQVLGLFLPGLKQVHGEHGRDIYDLDGSNWKYRLLRKFMRIFIDHYIAVSKDLEYWLLDSIRVERSRLTQIYNGVDKSCFRPVAGDRTGLLPVDFLPSPPFVIIGTVGRLVEVKDQRLILRALACLVEGEPALREILRVVIVGDGPQKGSLQQLAEELGVIDEVWFSGNRDDVSQLLQAMDIFLLPSLAEGISNTVLEAMSSGLPVIATDTGGNPELVEDGGNGYLIPVGDHERLAASIKILVESPDLRSEFGRNAMDRVQNCFDWDRTVGEYLEIYDHLLGIECDIARDGSNNVSQQNRG